MLTDAAAIFAQTRSAVASVAYPPSIAYSIVVAGIDGTVPTVNHYHAIDNTQSGDIRVGQMSDEEVAAPVTPHGTTFNFTFTLCIARGGCGGRTVPVGPPVAAPDLLGVPVLAPTYDFGIVGQSSSQRTNSNTTLPIIASVASSRKDYDVTLIGSEVLNGQPTIHLALRPLHDPQKYRLRELWINPNNHLPERAIVAGNFTRAGMANVPWSIVFQQIGAAWYVSKETPLSALHLPNHKVVRDASIVFKDIATNTNIYGSVLGTVDTSTALHEP